MKQATHITNAAREAGQTMADLCIGNESSWPCADLFFNGDDRGTFRAWLNEGRCWGMTPAQVAALLEGAK